MTENQIKAITKFVVDNSNRPFTKEERELIKQFVDKANSMGELIEIMTAAIMLK